MKLLIASDIHGSAYWCRALERVEAAFRPDRILLLGDLLYHGPRNDLPREYAPKEVISILSGWKDRIIAVRGNCEAEVDQMVLPFPCMADSAAVFADGLTLHLTHGHLPLPPLEPGTVVLSGHTHVKRDARVEGIRYLNPGSVSIPKDGSHSCLLLEDGQFTFRMLEEI